jgi:maleylpyruvate isomerase
MALDLASVLEHVRDSTRGFLSGLDGLTDADVSRPSLCPEWTVGHLLAHVERGGDGLRRSLKAPSAQRTSRGATRPIDEPVADVSESADC